MPNYLFFLQDPLTFNVLVIAASLFIMFKAADLLVDGISSYAKKFGLSNTIIGLVVVAMAASMPEVISSLTGLALNEMGILFGTILGTNMVHMTLVVGVLVLIGKKMNVKCEILEKQKLLLWCVLMVPFILILDGRLTRVDGIVMISLFVGYLVMLWRKEGTLGRLRRVPVKKLWRDVFIFTGSLLALLLAGRWLVFSVVNLAVEWGMPPYFLAITVIGVGSALPDFAVGLRSVLKGIPEMGIGDIIGSTVIELLLFFGLVALIKPMEVDVSSILVACIALIVSITIMMWLISLKKINWRHGLLLLSVYVIFVAVEAVRVFA